MSESIAQNCGVVPGAGEGRTVMVGVNNVSEMHVGFRRRCT